MRKKLLVVGGGAMIILAFCIGTAVALTCKKAKQKLEKLKDKDNKMTA